MAKANKYVDLFADALEEKTDENSTKSSTEMNHTRQVKRMERKTVPVSRIRKNPLNTFDCSEDEKFQDLLKGVERLGVTTEDIICQPEDEEGFYDIISGERRWMALQKANVERTAIKVLPERVTGSNEVVEIMNANSGRRGDYPYDIPRGLKLLYKLLEEEGITDPEEQKRIAREKLTISSDRSFRNYHLLSQLPDDIMLMGSGPNRYFTRDNGLLLASALTSEENRKFGEEAMERLREVAALDASINTKKSNCNKIIAELKQKIDRKANRTAAAKKPNAYATVKKIGKLASIEEYDLPKRKEEKEKMRMLIDSSMQFLTALKSKLEEGESNPND